MPKEAIPLKTRSTPRSTTLHPPDRHPDDSASSDPLSSPILVSQSSSRQPSRNSSPFSEIPPPGEWSRETIGDKTVDKQGEVESDSDLGFEDWNDQDVDDSNMPSHLRNSNQYPTDRRSHQPLLASKTDAPGYDESTRPGLLPRRSTLHERDPEAQASYETRKRYTYAAIFLALSLISFTVQTETAVYIQHQLKWEKAYCMLFLTHGSWTLLWPAQLLILRIQKWNTPWQTFWRRHVQLLRQTALMVEHGTLHPSVRVSQRSPVPYMMKMTAFVTCALTIAGGSWYVAVNMTTASDLTAIYNCSAFFAYAFSVPLLHERFQWSKSIAVAIAIAGVFVVAYGDSSPAKHGSKSGGGAGGDNAPPASEADKRTVGNLVIGVGSVLYGLYEVLYKKLACPPDGCSPGRGMIFANFFGSLIGSFTLLVLWIPLPILHFLGLETFELPVGKQAWMMAISVLANATFSGSFLVLISLTSPVLSSVAALLTIFIVAIVDQLLPEPLNSPLTPAAIVGGILIIGAFLLLSWATYKEMDEERRKKLEDVSESDVED
ncbi:hypothetical protein K432DRAFT_378045 [Lepidopterella palustris CBS 459.81]|uniref:EamA domain-containing protein n=1 Tax=Lepidopterella palustris CBS 459.81 TaxID=1314670 RepID=A0A8E2EJ73_9PEZI|nr:hypothetical protein K432DRAFT_378045 [Lepidopterella palustris CBS 459.81]